MVEFKHKVLSFLLVFAVAPFMSWSMTLANDEPWEDASCAEVNRSYLKTRAFPRYSVQMPLIREDGSTRTYRHMIFIESELQSWRVFDNKWIRSSRPLGKTWDRFIPKFTECRRIGEETNSDEKLIHYKVTWNKFPYVADTDIWISQDSDLLHRLRRHYLEGRWEFPEATIEEIFTYDPD